MTFKAATSVRIAITCVDIEGTLNKLNDHGVIFRKVIRNGEFNAEIHVSTKDYKQAISLLERKQIKYSVLDTDEPAQIGKILGSRMLLLFAMLFLIGVSLYLPGKILFVNVAGNTSVPERRILEAAGENGVVFGASAAAVRSEKVKNALLEAVPELQWIGVNTTGCVATIYVKEDKNEVLLEDSTEMVSSLVASTDGVVESYVVTRGTSLCKVGQAVKEEEILVSGYTDCGIVIKATSAQGEVIAQTRRSVRGVLPTNYMGNESLNGSDISYSICIGKKLIKFNNNSGIYEGSCAKIYKEHYMMLPGGYILPVSIIKETVLYYDTAADPVSYPADEKLLKEYCQEYLLSEMIAGSITKEVIEIVEQNNCYYLEGNYTCRELISRRRTEDIFKG